MTVTADQYPSNTLQVIEDMLVQCATFRALMGQAADTTPYTATRARIAFQDYRTKLAAPMCTLVLQPGEDGEPEAMTVTRHSETVEAYLCWPIDNTSADNEKQQALKALNAFGNLLAEFKALVGTGTNLARCSRAWEPPERTPDNGERPGCWNASLSIGITQ